MGGGRKELSRAGGRDLPVLEGSSAAASAGVEMMGRAPAFGHTRWICGN